MHTEAKKNKNTKQFVFKKSVHLSTSNEHYVIDFKYKLSSRMLKEQQ